MDRDLTRQREMADLFLSGMTLTQIGLKYGLSRERVRQIISPLGLRRHDGGKALQSREVAHQKRVARDIKCIKTHGCDFSTLQILRKNNATKLFREQRRNASNRGIEWSFTLFEWWWVWFKSGKWNSRGRKRGEYVMARHGDSGPYSLDKVSIITASNNTKEYWSDVWTGKRQRVYKG